MSGKPPNMNCPECGARLLLQAFWQGRYVNCTSCGARLERSISSIVLSALSGFVALTLAEWALTTVGAPMEIEIPLALLALAVGYGAVHVLTLRLKPREEEPTLKLR